MHSPSLILAALLLSSAAIAAPPADIEIANLPPAIRKQTRLLNPQYLLFSPGAPDRSASLPLLIFLHGGGGKGADITALRPRATELVARIRAHVKEPCVVVVPQCLKGTEQVKGVWTASDLNVLLAHLKATVPIDNRRIYLTGYSMGGYGTWAWASANPQHFAAVAPVAGGLGQAGPRDITPHFNQWAGQLATVPLWAFHGARDRVVPADRSQRMVKAIRDQGGKDVKLTVYPDTGHNLGKRPYSDPQFYRWLFQHRRPGSASSGNSDGLSAEKTDINARDTSYQREHRLPYLDRPIIDSEPDDRRDGIAVGSLADSVSGREAIVALAGEIAEGKYGNIDSVLIASQGKLVFESYFRRGRPDFPHYQMSITKSLAALALGRAIQLGHIENLDRPVVDHLSKIDRSKLVPGAAGITIAQCLNMHSGIRIPDGKARAALRQRSAPRGQGQAQLILSVSAPVTADSKAYKYQGTDPSLVMQVLEAVVPGSAEDFIKKDVLGRLGISNYAWQPDVSGFPKAAAGSSLRSRDMLKIGLLIANHGKWSGEQLWPRGFLRKAVGPLYTNKVGHTYGYFWWGSKMKVADQSHHCISARGAGGQFIFILPSLDLVVVVTSHNKEGAMKHPFTFTQETILPAFATAASSTEPRPAGSEATGGAIRLPRIFSDHMILQQKTSNAIWGWAEPGTPVSVKASWGARATATADRAGAWKLFLKTPAHGTGHHLTINRKTIRNVAIGEVWLCAGQSNMGWSMANSFGAEEEAAKANAPNLRIFKSAREHWHQPLDTPRDRLVQWKRCDSDSAAATSAVSYYFARTLHDELDVPVGIIVQAYAGTPIEGWMPEDIQADDPRTKAAMAGMEQLSRRFPRDEALQTFAKELADYNKKIADGETMKNQFRPLAPPIITKPAVLGHQYPAHIFNALIYPIRPYGIRGVIWYQGERNSKNPAQALNYRRQLTLLIDYYRRSWHELSGGNVAEDFPFFVTQLPSWTPPQSKPVEGENAPWAITREMMRLVASEVPNTGAVVSIDTGDAVELHPKNKKPIGLRHAWLALARVYGRDVPATGPIYRNTRIGGNKAIVEFSSVGTGLTAARPGKLDAFAIAGRDRKWHWADAVIQRSTIHLSSPQVPQPVAVRYAWAMNPS
ncbi:MAG: serine hydrolase, partial [Phycisphaerae bacterium]|nr:serine hydrolase [Phycisphaerae bacterium]